jgi:hypothetical protein
MWYLVLSESLPDQKENRSSRNRVGADSLADSSPMDGSSLLQREVRRDFSWLERSSPARPLFVARLLGRQTVRLSILAAPDPCSVVRHILIGRAPNAERHRVRRRVLPPVHKNQRCSLRWVFAYRTAHRGFVFAASGATGVARRRSALSARSELWS